MVEIKIQISERQLAEMDRMLRKNSICGNQWLKDAVTIYKSLLITRKARYETLSTGHPLSCRPQRVAAIG